MSVAQGHGQLRPRWGGGLRESRARPMGVAVAGFDPTDTKQPSVPQGHPGSLPLAGLDKPDWDPGDSLEGEQSPHCDNHTLLG